MRFSFLFFRCGIFIESPLNTTWNNSLLKMNDLIQESHCDWCETYTQTPSLVMGYSGFQGMGDCLCTTCLNKEKSNLYLVKYAGRQMFSSSEYYNQYWKNQKKIKVVRTPKDHQEIAKSDDEDSMDEMTE